MPIKKILNEAKRTATNNVVRNMTAGTIFGNPQDNMITDMQGGRQGKFFATGGQSNQIQGQQVTNNQMMATQGIPQTPTQQPQQAPNGFQDMQLADGTIQRINMTNGDIVHKRTSTPAGFQDIDLANGNIKRINLQTGESEVI